MIPFYLFAVISWIINGMYMNVIYAHKGPTMEIKFILFYSILLYSAEIFIRNSSANS